MAFDFRLTFLNTNPFFGDFSKVKRMIGKPIVWVIINAVEKKCQNFLKGDQFFSSFSSKPMDCAKKMNVPLEDKKKYAFQEKFNKLIQNVGMDFINLEFNFGICYRDSGIYKQLFSGFRKTGYLTIFTDNTLP